MSNFSQLNLNEKIVQTLSEIGYESPTPIQANAIPKILEGSDIIACAQTGTGKTAAFMLPAIHSLIDQSPPKSGTPKVLVLVPTRELAIQVAAEAKKFCKNLTKVKTVCIYGGIPYPVQKKALASRFEILVATPGRLLDQVESGRINLSEIQLFILDEADRMLDMGFIEDVEKIAARTPEKRQTLLFSATIDKKILPFSRKLQKNPFEIKIEVNLENRNSIEQQLYYVNHMDHKVQILDHLLENTEISQCIIFASTKIQTTELAYALQDKGYRCDALNGDMNQRQRTRTIGRLRSGMIQFLIATDVAARGIDISDLSHVINFDLPFQADDFIHRIGRTGRAGAKGVAITFSTYKEEPLLSRIQDLLLKPMEICSIAGLEPKPKDISAKKRPLRNPYKGGRSGSFRGERSGSPERSERQPRFDRPASPSRTDNGDRSAPFKKSETSFERPSRSRRSEGPYRFNASSQGGEAKRFDRAPRAEDGSRFSSPSRGGESKRFDRQPRSDSRPSFERNDAPFSANRPRRENKKSFGAPARSFVKKG